MFSTYTASIILLCSTSAFAVENVVPRAIPYPEEAPDAALPASVKTSAPDELVGPPAPSEAQKLAELLKPPFDFAAIEQAINDNRFSAEKLQHKLPKGLFPNEFLAASQSNLLPFKKARLDIFMQGSRIHGIGKSFSILSLDDEVRAIGLVSTGSVGHATPAQRWEIYGVDKNRGSYSYGGSPMPYAFMLSIAGGKFYSETALHGTNGYGYGQFGTDVSHGCVRQYTESYVFKGTADPGANWPQWGYHRVLWNLLNPDNVAVADHLPNYIYGSWYSESDTDRAFVQELRYKTTVFTHRNSSLKQLSGWKDTFERLYPKDLIESVVNAKRPYRGFAWAEVEGATLDRKVINVPFFKNGTKLASLVSHNPKRCDDDKPGKEAEKIFYS